MSKTVFYVLLGESGSGKDFTASLVGYPVVKFASPQKRKLEREYNLPLGSLEHRGIKDLRPSGGQSYLEMLINEYHNQQYYYNQTGLESFINDRRETTVKEIQFYIQRGLPIMFTDCRNTYEAELIKWFAEIDWIDIVIHRLYRTGSICLTSDERIDQVSGILEPSAKIYRSTTDISQDQISDLYSKFRYLHQ